MAVTLFISAGVQEDLLSYKFQSGLSPGDPAEGLQCFHKTLGSC